MSGTVTFGAAFLATVTGKPIRNECHMLESTTFSCGANLQLYVNQHGTAQMLSERNVDGIAQVALLPQLAVAGTFRIVVQLTWKTSCICKSIQTQTGTV